MGDLTLDLKAILTIVSIVTAIILALIFQWWRNRKQLTYRILTNAQLLNRKDEVRDKIQLLFGGEAVENVQLMILRITNSGRQSIDEKDFKKPLDFVFADGNTSDCSILTADVVKVEPDNLKVLISSGGNKLTIEPMLLNYKDAFEVKVLLNARNANVSPDVRIAGMRTLRLSERKPMLQAAFWGVIFSGFVWGGLGFIISGLEADLAFLTLLITFVLIVVIGSGVIFTYFPLFGKDR